MPSIDSYTLFVGIDIAARSASVAWFTDSQHSERAFSVKRTPVGIVELQQRLLTIHPQPQQIRVILEVTGAYWLTIARALYDAHFALSVIHPAQANHFAQALLQRAKTDSLDAMTLALLGRQLQPSLWQPAPPIYEELHQRLAQREALIHLRAQTLNRLHSLQQRPDIAAPVQTRLKALYDFTHQQIKMIDRELPAVIRQDPAWQATAQRLLSIKGIGLITAAWLLTTTVNFTACESPEQLVSYVGFAPYIRQSGTGLNSFRHVGHVGNASLRQILYMAAITAVRSNPVIRDYYLHLVSRGKNGKVATVAAARKLLHIAWAVATKQQMFDATYAQKDNSSAAS